MQLDLVIMDSDRWHGILSLIKQGLSFLDSIVLFDTGTVHLTFLGFDIAVMIFCLVWDTAALWGIDGEWSPGRLNSYYTSSEVDNNGGSDNDD